MKIKIHNYGVFLKRYFFAEYLNSHIDPNFQQLWWSNPFLHGSADCDKFWYVKSEVVFPYNVARIGSKGHMLHTSWDIHLRTQDFLENLNTDSKFNCSAKSANWALRRHICEAWKQYVFFLDFLVEKFVSCCWKGKIRMKEDIIGDSAGAANQQVGKEHWLLTLLASKSDRESKCHL